MYNRFHRIISAEAFLTDTVFKLFFLGLDFSMSSIPGPSEVKSFMFSGRETYLMIVNGKEFGKTKERRNEKV